LQLKAHRSHQWEDERVGEVLLAGVDEHPLAKRRGGAVLPLLVARTLTELYKLIIRTGYFPND